MVPAEIARDALLTHPLLMRDDGRDEKGRFLPGVSGNPRGRPPSLPGIVKKFREKGEAALEAAEAILDDPGHPKHFECVKWWIERGYGKPRIPLSIDREGEDDATVLSDAELEEILREECDGD